MTKFSFISKIKLNKKIPMIKHFVLLISILLLLVLAVLAWFGTNEKANANGLSISMSAGKNLLISLDDGQNFVTSINLLGTDDQALIGEKNQIKDKLNMDDITSDGLTFFRPVFNETEGVREPNTDAEWDYASKNRSYISQTIIFRTEKASDIFMGSGTKIVTSCEDSNKKLVSANADEIGNKHGEYNFSKDCIVGALRISAIDSDENLCFVCIPRSDVELVRGQDTISMNSGQSVSNDAKIHTYYSTNYQEEDAPVSTNNVIYGFNGSQKIATTTYNEETKFYEATAIVNVWLEGCDPETTRVLSGGKFNIVFDFVATET